MATVEILADGHGRKPPGQCCRLRAVETDVARERERRCQRRVGRRPRHRVGHGLIDRARVRGTHRGPPVARRIPDHAEARRYIVGGVVDRVASAGSDAHQLPRRRIEDDEPVLRFLRRAIRVEPDAKIERQVPADLIRVAHEEPVRQHADVGRPIAQCDGEVAAEACLEACHAREGELARVGNEAYATETPPLTAELQRMVAARQRRSVRDHVGRVLASLRESLRAAEVECDTIDNDLRQGEGPRDAGVDAERRRVQHGVRVERDVDPVEPGTRLVHQPLAEDVRFVQRADLTVRVTRIAEAGNRVELQRRLAAQVLLKRVVPMQNVARAHCLADVTGPLVDVHRRHLRPDEACRPVDRGVGARNELQELPRDRVGHRRALGVGQHTAVDVDPLALPEPFICREEERAVLHDGAAERPAELVPRERRFPRRLDVERVARIETIVTVELEHLARKDVAARPRRDVDDCARIPAVFGAERRVIHLEFLHRVDRRLERDLVLLHVVQVDAVDHEVHGVFTIAGGVERERSLAAQRRRQEAVLRRRHRARDQQSHLDEVPTV